MLPCIRRPRHRVLSLVALGLLVACDADPREVGLPGEGGHGHHHAAPHGGCLLVLGDEVAHVELLADPETGWLRLWVLDAHAQNAVRLQQERIPLRLLTDGTEHSITLQGVARALTGESANDTSEFEAHVVELKGAKRIVAWIDSLTVRGVRFEALEFRLSPDSEEGLQESR